MDTKRVAGSVQRLLRELFEGASIARGSYVLNQEDDGILGTLDRLAAEQASAELIPGRATIAGHANHLRYSLELLNRAAKGENVFATADWPGSWNVRRVDEVEWRELRDSLRDEYEAWRDALDDPPEPLMKELTGVLSTPAHFGYHFGAIRQLLGVLEAR